MIVHKTIVTPELEAKVIRCYVERDMSFTMIANLGICNQKISSEILKKHNIPLHKKELDFKRVVK